MDNDARKFQERLLKEITTLNRYLRSLLRLIQGAIGQFRPSEGLKEKATNSDDANSRNSPNPNSSRAAEKADSLGKLKSVIEIVAYLFAIGYAVVTFCQWQSSIHSFRIDERSLLKMRVMPNGSGRRVNVPFKEGQTVYVPMQLTNIGKTSALNIVIDMYVEVLPLSTAPNLPNVQKDDPPSAHTSTGILFPNEPIFAVGAPMEKKGNNFQFRLMTDRDVADAQAGKTYIAIYGVVKYEDIFHTPHWTKFCEAIEEEKDPTPSANSRDCTAYNDVDKN